MPGPPVLSTSCISNFSMDWLVATQNIVEEAENLLRNGDQLQKLRENRKKNLGFLRAFCLTLCRGIIDCSATAYFLGKPKIRLSKTFRGNRKEQVAEHLNLLSTLASAQHWNDYFANANLKGKLPNPNFFGKPEIVYFPSAVCLIWCWKYERHLPWPMFHIIVHEIYNPKKNSLLEIFHSVSLGWCRKRRLVRKCTRKLVLAISRLKKPKQRRLLGVQVSCILHNFVNQHSEPHVYNYILRDKFW